MNYPLIIPPDAEYPLAFETQILQNFWLPDYFHVDNSSHLLAGFISVSALFNFLEYLSYNGLFSHYLIGSARSVVVIVVGNGHGDTSSNPGRDIAFFFWLWDTISGAMRNAEYPFIAITPRPTLT